MKRRCGLDSLLSYRESLVEAREMELAEAVRMQSVAEETLAALREKRERTLREVRNLRRNARLDQLGLLTTEAYLTRLEAELAHQAAMVEELAQRTEACRSALSAALQEKKKIERLKEREEQRRAQQEARLEQKLVDDLNVTRHGRKEMGSSYELDDRQH